MADALGGVKDEVGMQVVGLGLLSGDFRQPRNRMRVIRYQADGKKLSPDGLLLGGRVTRNPRRETRNTASVDHEEFSAHARF
jgi:hypothetical protein